ncbi:hypothetical protein JFU47_27805 [Pseudomonas sp. TH39(2020)]|uniref:hypothetical protein n=1 Tax=Pseudomonas sp. TH39(2020) TaxID=2796349 RepID=UPI0019139CDB|nr:hypothetical protein [Pseudomonas sp. TH39(2020)]MBK5400479.1 hypothetical protein [Pseudomonas sp. TH39(2020)]
MSKYTIKPGTGAEKNKWYVLVGQQRLGGPYKSEQEAWEAAEFFESKQENPQPIDDKPKFF